MKHYIKIILLIFLLNSTVFGAAIQSNGTGGGNWSAGASWNGGVAPANGDSVTILNGDDITLNSDLITAAIDLAGITINDGGHLICSTATGTYSILCSADIVVSGTDGLQAGTSTSVPLPSDVTFTIDFDGTASSIEGNDAGSIKLYCGEPTNKWVRLSGAEAAGQTELSIDSDVTADIWAATDDVAVVGNVPITTIEDVEKSTIAAGGIAATAITIDDALANDKIEDDYLVLLSRNIEIKGSTTYVVEDCPNSDIYAYLNGGSGIYSSANINIGGSMWIDMTRGLYLCTNVYFDCSMVDDGLASDNGMQNVYELTSSSNALIGGFYCAVQTLSNAIWDGLIYGCRVGSISSISTSFNGVIEGCYTGAQASSDCAYYGDYINISYSGLYGSQGGCIAGNIEIDALYCLEYVSSMKLYNVLFTAGTSEFKDYDGSQRSKFNYVESLNHDQVENAYKAWVRGGIVTSQTASPPTGYSIWYELDSEDDSQTYPVFRQYETTVQPGTTIEVEGQIRIADGEDLSASGLEPQLQIIDKFADPLVDSTQSPLDYDIPDDVTGTTTTWQDVSVIWANQGDAPRQVIVRMIAYHDGVAADHVYVDTVWSIADYQDQIAAIYNKLPTNYIMGSSVQSDKDDEIDAIKAKTDNLPSDPADDSDIDAAIAALNDLSAAQVNAEVDTALADYDPPTRTEAAADKDAIITEVNANETKIDTAQADLDIITGADGVIISAAALTSIWAKAMVDLPAGAPSATCSVLTAINYLYESWRNNITTTANKITVHKDDGTTALTESDIVDDGVEFSKGEYRTPD